MEERKCAECGTPIKGRADKKFCTDQCRNAYHNTLNSDRNNYVRNVNNILRRNRRILTECNPRGKSKVHRDKLTALGFNFSYFTSTYTTKNGHTYFYCYEQGYLPLENDIYALVVKQEYVA